MVTYELRGPIGNLKVEGDTLIVGEDIAELLPIEIMSRVVEDNRSNKYAEALVEQQGLRVKTDQFISIQA